MMSYLLVAAIDFGTTFSGWAFSFKHDFERDPTKITAKNWHGDQLISQKAPTCVLIKPDGRTFDSFGYTAESKYAELVAEEKHEQWYFFRRFKMMLFDKIEDACGKQLSAKKVFSMVIKFLKDDLLEECSNQLGDSINDKDVKWVLTVPAIWNDVAKQFMREAAIKAGIMKEHLLIALEPEAASIFCRHLPVDKAEGEEEVSLASMKAGTKYMVVDAGGGTVDITFHQVIVDDKLREIHKASGGAWGGTRIDDEYEKFLDSLFGQDIMKKFQKQNMDDYFDMMRAFEIKKRDLKLKGANKVTIRIPPSLIDIVQENRGKQLKDIITESKYNGNITYVSGKIRVYPELLIALFKDTVAKIIKHMNSLLQEEKCHDCSTIVLAGGFAESYILQEAIRDAFKGMRLIIPNGTGLVVLKGAVIFGHRPATIVERVCRYSYGLKGSHRTSEECKHPPTKTTEGKDGIKRCKNLFKIYARCGETVELTEERSTYLGCPRYDDQTNIGYTIYASENENPLLTTEDKCFELGRLKIPISDTSFGRNRLFEKSFIFGDTEIIVKVVDKVSKEVYLLSVNCLE
ncbi:heat shock 70 kDa protein 12A-like [Ruditapes philippinarum]|uniref:heat shock 70 kDa protein 12A-like n=1 Tax=Ruditapes philippinarum TaxID=129788 RepID=UPI00295C287B|nr:heat shock 70 kDa protein 12A-like [Ruditapes philippinarum]